MAVVIDRPIERPKASPAMEEAHLKLDRGPAFSANPDSGQGSSFDGLLIWICGGCWLLLGALHVNEVLAWIFGR